MLICHLSDDGHIVSCTELNSMWNQNFVTPNQVNSGFLLDVAVVVKFRRENQVLFEALIWCMSVNLTNELVLAC